MGFCLREQPPDRSPQPKVPRPVRSRHRAREPDGRRAGQRDRDGGDRAKYQGYELARRRGTGIRRPNGCPTEDHALKGDSICHPSRSQGGRKEVARTCSAEVASGVARVARTCSARVASKGSQGRKGRKDMQRRVARGSQKGVAKGRKDMQRRPSPLFSVAILRMPYDRRRACEGAWSAGEGERAWAMVHRKVSFNAVILKGRKSGVAGGRRVARVARTCSAGSQGHAAQAIPAFQRGHSANAARNAERGDF
jgi:hypothetical protein